MLQLLYILFSITDGSEVAPFWWAMTWLQMIIPVLSLHWAAAAWCRWGGSHWCLGNLLRSWWVCANTAGPLSNLNFTFLLLSAAFPKILSWVLDFQIYHSCTLWFMLTGSLPKTSLLRSLFQHHGSFPEQDSPGWEADPPSRLLLGPNKLLWEGTFPSAAFVLHHLLLQLQDAFLWLCHLYHYHNLICYVYVLKACWWVFIFTC